MHYRGVLFRKTVIVLAIVIGVTGCTGKTSTDLCAEGASELRQGNAIGAIDFFKNALEKDQSNIDARYQLARAYMSAGKYDKAEKEFQKLQRQTSSLPDMKLYLGKLYKLLKKPESTIRQPLKIS